MRNEGLMAELDEMHRVLEVCEAEEIVELMAGRSVARNGGGEVRPSAGAMRKLGVVVFGRAWRLMRERSAVGAAEMMLGDLDDEDQRALALEAIRWIKREPVLARDGAPQGRDDATKGDVGCR